MMSLEITKKHYNLIHGVDAEPGAKNCHLSDPKYGYDLVVSTTATAINNNIKRTMKNKRKNKNSTVVWYQQSTPTSPAIPMNPITGLNPFSISLENDPPQAILESDFTFAIKAGFDLPSEDDFIQLPNMVIFDRGSKAATYQLYFPTLEIITLSRNEKGSPVWKKIEQSAGNPILFKFIADLNFEDAEEEGFDKLPAAAKAQFTIEDDQSAFNVQQIFLDLATAKLENAPRIESLPSTGPIYTTLLNDFINTYWNTHHPKGKFILGQAVQKNNVLPQTGATQPTSLNLEVVPHCDENGNKTNQFDLYTLNYLMKVNHQKLPTPVPFAWNWVKRKNAVHHDGVMAIKRDIFAKSLAKNLMKHLSGVCITPAVTFEIPTIFDHLKSFDFKPAIANFQYVDRNTNGVKNKMKNLGWTEEHKNRTILSLNFHSTAEASDSIGLQYGQFKLVSKNRALVAVKGKEIKLSMKATMDIDFDPGNIAYLGAEGRVATYKTTAIYVTSVDESGKMVVKMKAGYPKKVLAPSKFKSALFNESDGSNGLTSAITNCYALIPDKLQSYTSHLENLLNNSANNWVFPGGMSLQFKDVVFSDHQDLVTPIKYGIIPKTNKKKTGRPKNRRR